MKGEIFRFDLEFWELCEKNNDKIMIVYDMGHSTIRYTYKEVSDYVRRWLCLFQKRGLCPGDTVVCLMPNSPETIVCFFASILGGYNFAPIPCQASEREINNWIALTRPKIMFRKIEKQECELGDFSEIICKCDGDFSWLPEGMADIERTESPAIYLLTSGTTGTPKAMIIDRDTLWSSGCAFVDFYSIKNSEYRFWNYLPMSYLGGLFNLAIIPLCCGGSFVITEPFSGKMVINFWNMVQRHNITALWFVPSIVHGLLQISKIIGPAYKKVIVNNIKIALLGTAPIQLKIKEEFESVFGITLLENFALSETTFLTAETTDNIRYREQSSVGAVLPYVEFKMIPVNTAENINQLWVKTPYLFKGYLGAEGIVNLEVDDEGFFNTKDLGRVNEDGQIVLAGRSRDIVKKGGLFVSLAEIENLVGQRADIEEVAAVPIEHEFYGESYVLYVVFKDNSQDMNIAISELHSWLLENIVSYKMPEAIESCSAFPKTASGKIQKNILSDNYYAKNAK